MVLDLALELGREGKKAREGRAKSFYSLRPFDIK